MREISGRGLAVCDHIEAQLFVGTGSHGVFGLFILASFHPSYDRVLGRFIRQTAFVFTESLRKVI